MRSQLNQRLTQPQTTPKNYRQRVKVRFKKEVDEIVNKYSLTELVIVLDTTSAFLLSNILSINDLVSMKIIFIEKLEVERKKLDKHALYFITPSRINIDRIIKDFPVLKEQEVPQYRRIHLLFTTFVDRELIKQLAMSKGVLKRIAKNSLKQFYFSARIIAPNLIDMNLPYLGIAFSKQSQQEVLKRQLICKKIIEFVANYNEINTIRVFYKKSPNKICEMVALRLEDTIKKYLGILLENRSPNLSKNAPDLTILMMDRSVDTVTPFLHYFTYESLLFDFFKVSMTTKSNLQDKQCYSYEEILNPVYDEFRYKHISDALAQLPEALENERGRLESLKSLGHQTVNIKQLTQRIGHIRQNIEKLEIIWKQFQQKNMQDLADLEQSLATGLTANMQNTSSVKLIEEVEAYIKNPNIDREQKLRLAVLCLSCIKMSKDDYGTMMNLFNNEDQKILKNLIALGVCYDGSLSKSTKTITKQQQKIAQKRMEATGMHLNRYTSIVQLVVPLFSQILTDPLQTKNIDSDVFGELVCSTFNSEERKFVKDRFAVCMVGGLSWAEVSAIRNSKELTETVLMADSIMTAPQFLKQISKINIVNS